MKKVNILLFLALLFITAVMILVMVQGVSLKERQMVKWSSVESAEMGTRKITNFFFPILSEWEKVNISGENPITKKIYQSFEKRGHEISSKTQITLNAPVGDKRQFEIQVVFPQREEALQNCKQGKKESCVIIKALNKFDKKKRDSSLTWLSLYRISESKVLFLVIPEI